MLTALYPADLKAPEVSLGRLRHQDRYQHELDYLLTRANISKPVLLNSYSWRLPHAGVIWNFWRRTCSVEANPMMLDGLTPTERLAVLAHEVGHIACNHSLRFLAFLVARVVAEVTCYVMLVLQVMAHGWWVLLVGIPLVMMFNALGYGLNMAYRRHAEYQADAAAVRILGPAYALPLLAGIYKCEQAMEMQVYARGGTPVRLTGFRWWLLSTHPRNPERCSALGIKTYEVFTYLRTQRIT